MRWPALTPRLVRNGVIGKPLAAVEVFELKGEGVRWLNVSSKQVPECYPRDNDDRDQTVEKKSVDTSQSCKEDGDYKCRCEEQDGSGLVHFHHGDPALPHIIREYAYDNDEVSQEGPEGLILPQVGVEKGY